MPRPDPCELSRSAAGGRKRIDVVQKLIRYIAGFGAQLDYSQFFHVKSLPLLVLLPCVRLYGPGWIGLQQVPERNAVFVAIPPLGVFLLPRQRMDLAPVGIG